MCASLISGRMMSLGLQSAEQPAARAAEPVRVIIGMLLMLFWVVLAVAHREKMLGDPDIWWHIRTGAWMWEHGTVPTADPFSHSFAGQPWIAKEWLSQLIFFSAHSVAGWNGVNLVTAAALGLAAAALYKAVSDHLTPLLAASVTLACLFLASNTLVARPHLLTIMLLIVWTHQLFEASRKQVAPHYGWLLVILLWANLHAAFTVGFVIAAFAFLDFLERTRLASKDVLLKWLVFLALCPLVTLLHPYTYQVILATWSVAGPNEAVPLINEWQPFNARDLLLHEIALLGLVFMSVVSGFRLGIARSLLLVLLLHLFLTHVRFGYILFPVLPLIVVSAIAQQFPRLSAENWRVQPKDVIERATAHAFRPLLVSIGAGLVVTFGLQALVFPTSPPRTAAVTAAIEFVKSRGLSGNVMNSYNFGGPLIFNGIPTFIDGRTDQLFLGGFAGKFMKGPDSEDAMAEALRHHDIAWTLFEPKDHRAAMLDKLPGWKRVFGDEFAVIHQRQASVSED
jgi:hypothetical protein